MSKKPHDHTQGSVIKSLILLSVPVIFTQILLTAYQLTDTFWVGRLGAEAIASVSISFPVMFVIISFGIGLSIAGTVFVSQYKGKKNQEAINRYSGQTLIMSVFVSLFLALIGYITAPQVIHLIGAEPSIFDDAVSYLRISLFGMVFSFIFMSFQSLLRGVARVKIPMIIITSTVILNFILDPLLIFGFYSIPAYGVEGAAIATFLTEAISALAGIFVLMKGNNGIHITKKHLIPDFNLILKLTKVGLPASLEQSTRGLGFAVMTFFVAGFGTTVMASFGIGFRILTFIIIPALGLSMAVSTLVGQNIGAGKIHRAEEVVRLANWVGFITLSLIGVLMFFFARQISGFFIPEDIEVIRQSSLFIKIMALSFGFIGIQFGIIGAFRGSGNTSTAMILSIISQWILQLPLVYILINYTNLSELGIWISYPISNAIMALISFVWYSKGDWKNKKITEDRKIKARIEAEIEDSY